MSLNIIVIAGSINNYSSARNITIQSKSDYGNNYESLLFTLIEGIRKNFLTLGILKTSICTVVNKLLVTQYMNSACSRNGNSQVSEYSTA